jgi:ATP-dependent Clp protease adaptor protein ClpS
VPGATRAHLRDSKMTNAETQLRINTVLKEPPMFKVIYINDDKTTSEFVVSSLMNHFEYTELTAEEITVNIHETGSAVVAVLPYEIAEQKGIEVTVNARSEGYPLQIKLEPDVA